MDLDQSAILRSRLGQLETVSKAVRVDTIVALIATATAFILCGFFKLPTIYFALTGLPAVIAMVIWLIAQQLLRRAPPLTAVRAWEKLFTTLLALKGLAWGGLCAYALYDGSAALAQVFLAMAAVLSVFKLASFAGFGAPIVLFTTAALLPPTTVFAMQQSTFGFLAAGLSLAFVGGMTFAAKIVTEHADKRYAMEADNEEIRRLLDQRRTQVEKLNVALKTNQDKRDEAESTLRRQAADLGLAQGKAKALATTLERVSPLCQVTGLANRRRFDENLEAEWRRAMREGAPVSLLLIDVDEFDLYVEAYGQQSADTLLKRVGQSVKGFGRRAGDMAGRYSESTLALLLPRCDVRNALRMAEALRKRVESSKVAHSGAKNRATITAHIGVATTKPARGIPTSELLKRADAALYEARFQGGNKVISYKPLSKLRVQKWDKNNDGQLNEQSMIQKLLVWGYDTTKNLLNPKDKMTEHVSEHDTVLALLDGELVLELEGHTMSISPGDTIFVPHDVVVNLKAGGEKIATVFAATKSK